MADVSIEPLELERVKISVQAHEDGIKVLLSGMIDMRDPSAEILPYLLEIHKGVIKNKIKKVWADFSDLTFMNSSGIKAIIQWLMKLKDLTGDDRYEIIILQNLDITWQASSLQVMQQLFKDFLTVETIE